MNWHWGSICLFFESFPSLFSTHSPYHPSLAQKGITCTHPQSISQSCSACSYLQQLHNTLLNIISPLRPAHYPKGVSARTHPSLWLERLQHQVDIHSEDWELIQKELEKEKEARQSLQIKAAEEKSKRNIAGNRIKKVSDIDSKGMNRPGNSSDYDDDDDGDVSQRRNNLSISSLSYHLLSPSFRLLLLHLLCDWSTQTKTLHELIENGDNMHSPQVYGYDDNEFRYFLFLHPQVERIHFYKEEQVFQIHQVNQNPTTSTNGKLSGNSGDKKNKNSFKSRSSNSHSDSTSSHIIFHLLAWDAETCQIAVTTLLSHTSQRAKELILTEALPTLEQVARQAERRLRRIAKLEVDLGNIISPEEGIGRATRKRKAVDYKEIEDPMEEEEGEGNQRNEIKGRRATEEDEEYRNEDVEQNSRDEGSGEAEEEYNLMEEERDNIKEEDNKLLPAQKDQSRKDENVEVEEDKRKGVESSQSAVVLETESQLNTDDDGNLNTREYNETEKVYSPPLKTKELVYDWKEKEADRAINEKDSPSSVQPIDSAELYRNQRTKLISD